MASSMPNTAAWKTSAVKKDDVDVLVAAAFEVSNMDLEDDQPCKLQRSHKT